MKAVILAAGIGKRLNNPLPKSLSVLPNKEKILGRQVRLIRQSGIREIYVVAGFKMSLIVEAFPDLFYVCNPDYSMTNTAKSLLAGIRNFSGDVVWLNGDVVFDEAVILQVAGMPGNVIGVNRSQCAEEEVKYRLNDRGLIAEISKQVKSGQGEAVGINKVTGQTLPLLIQALEECADEDYFEKAIELVISRGAEFRPADISAHMCIEVDFKEDWEKVQSRFDDFS